MPLSRKQLLETAASLGLLAAVRAPASAAVAAPPAATNAAAVVGAWKLESFVIDSSSESEKPRFGLNPVGYLIYTASGRMSATLMAAHRARLDTPNGAMSTPRELADSLGNFLSYAGTYEIRGNHVFHHIEVSVFTNLVGTTLEREFTLAGDTLTIRTLPPEIWGTSNRLVWKRA
ncbi:MAG: lipocalin-like domain-containing protein [Candidatus Eremiobacteraeota bacterium]|nr:lipocalin-like domain-containing protein [Candidatus Eremiobacteraeota bacterium]